MKRFFNAIFVLLFLFPVVQNDICRISAQAQSNTIKGVVYHDRNYNGKLDSRDKPLKGVALSNGRDVVVTNRRGEYELPVRDNAAIFVIKPRNWMVAVDDNQVPRYYVMHSREGLSGDRYGGLPASGELPGSLNFPLYPSKEPKKIKGLIFGDTQPRNLQEIYYASKAILPELIGTDANFGVTLGDIVFNDLSLFNDVAGSLSVVGVPMWYVPGNHDVDFTARDRVAGRGAWFNTFGPNYYSFTYGPAHFVVLDNIYWTGEEDNPYSNYTTGLGEDQMQFLENEINRIDKKQWLVILAHIPSEASTKWINQEEKERFYSLLSRHEKTISLAAHTHRHFHHFVGKEQNYPGEGPLHMVSVGTVCGAWWTGAPDIYGVPHAMMRDGTPNGYAFLHIDEKDWSLEWKVARKPEDFQMHISIPDVITIDDSGDKVKVLANIFNAMPDAEVKMRVGEEGEWVDMECKSQKDPYRVAEMEREEKMENLSWRKMTGVVASRHIWEAEFRPEFDNPGFYSIYVKAKDRWHQFEGRQIIHVVLP